MTTRRTQYTNSRKVAVLLECLVIAVGCARASETPAKSGLQPSADWLGSGDEFGYLVEVYETLFADATSFRESQMLSMTTNGLEQVVFIDATEGGRGRYEVVHTVAEQSVYDAYSEEQPNRVATHTSRAVIEAELARKLSRTWFCAIAQSEYQPLRIGVAHKIALEGARYQLGTSVPGVRWAGAITTSPAFDSVAGRLVALGNLLAQYADASEERRNLLGSAVRARVDGLWLEVLARPGSNEMCDMLVD